MAIRMHALWLVSTLLSTLLLGCGGGSGTFSAPLLDNVPSQTQQSVLLLQGEKPKGMAVQLGGIQVTPVDDSESFSLAVTLHPGVNQLIVNFVDASGEQSEPAQASVTFTDMAAISQPRPVTPAADERLLTSFPTFRWASAGQNNDQELFSYRLDIATDRNFTANLASYSAGGQLSFTPTAPVPAGAAYWRVCASAPGGGAVVTCGPTRLFFTGRNPSDVTGDGLGDVVIGAPQNDFFDADAGSVSFAFGAAAGGAPSTINQRIIGKTTQGHFGASVVTGLDVNGDATGDLLVGEPGAPGSNIGGQVLVYYGAPAFPYVEDAYIPPDTGYVGFGRSMTVVGDFNGDGLDDVAIGAPDSTQGGVVDLFCGDTQVGLSFCASFRREVSGGAQQNLPDKFGAALARLGDFNGDGYSDLAIGAPGLFDQGAVYIYFGGPNFDTHADLTFTGDSAGHGFGAVLAGGLDFNGDGFADLAIGTPDAAASLENGSGAGLGSNAGSVELYFGRTMNNVGTLPKVTLRGAGVGDALGSSLVFIDKISGTDAIDGKPAADLIIGAPGKNFDDGIVYVLRGRGAIPMQPPLPDSLNETIQSLNPGGRFGSALSVVRGFVGPSSSNNASLSGSDAFVVGSPLGLLQNGLTFRPGAADVLQNGTLAPIGHFTGQNDQDQFGFSLGDFR